MQVDFEREKSWWDAKAHKEDEEIGDVFINRALHWRELERHLAGVQTILEIGGGTGAFSIPLAERGYEVTHVDFSPAMLAIAKERGAHLPKLHFVEANAISLPFKNASFDLVMNIGGAISFCGSEAERAIEESCRIARKKIIVSVLNRGNLAGLALQASLQLANKILPMVYAMFDKGEWHQEQFPENPMFSKGATQEYMGAMKAFLPNELECILQNAGMRPVLVHGLGSLARWFDQETLERMRSNAALYEEFLDLCERFDSEIMPGGTGTRERMGLIAVAERK